MVTLVILPGLDGTGLELADFVAALGPELETIVVTYPNDTPTEYAGHEVIARGKLPVDRPFVLLGESYSGPIAILIAASAPRGLIGLILCCSFARNPRPALSWLRPFVRLVPTRIPAAVTGWFLLGRSSTPRLRAALADALAQIAPETLRARLASVMEVDVTAQLAKVRVPVFYLRATRDRTVPPRVSLEVLRSIPDARVVDIDGPHLLLQTAPAIAARQLKSFVKDMAVDEELA
jgi:pimeloyl-ACP methyl ester carboxylesterase